MIPRDDSGAPLGVEVDRYERVPGLARAEILAWSLLARLLVRTCSLRRAVALLDAVPRPPGTSRRDLGPIAPEAAFGRAGACLGRSLARSQFLRMRRRPHAIVIGTRGGAATLRAHAWIEPCDQPAPTFVEIRRIRR